MIGIIDYGLGNAYSVQSAFSDIGVKSILLDVPNLLPVEIQGLVIPGVGNFGEGIVKLKKSGWFNFLKDNGTDGVPILGICLGMHMLFSSSEESPLDRGLDLISAEVTKLPQGQIRIPNMGWRTLDNCSHSVLLKGLTNERFYHVHSYGVTDIGKKGDTKLKINNSEIIVSIRRGNVFGVQFHPEKSLKQGLVLLSNFYTYCNNEDNSNITD